MTSGRNNMSYIPATNLTSSCWFFFNDNVNKKYLIGVRLKMSNFKLCVKDNPSCCDGVQTHRYTERGHGVYQLVFLFRKIQGRNTFETLFYLNNSRLAFTFYKVLFLIFLFLDQIHHHIYLLYTTKSIININNANYLGFFNENLARVISTIFS